MDEKAYSFRIYPNKNQEVKLNRTLNTCRHLYNDALSERKRQAELNRLKKDFQVFPWGKPEWISYEDQANTLSSEKNPLQKEVHSQVLQNTLKRLDRSFKNFFIGFRYPRFQGKSRYNTFTYPQSGFKLENGKINLSKIGNIKIVQHRDIEGKIKTCTIKRDVDQWYAIFTVEAEKPEKLVKQIKSHSKIGIDVGLLSLLTLSNGEKIEPPKFLRLLENKLAKEQIRLSREKLKSTNRKKQVITIARIHREIRNQRKDFAHKTARTLVNRFDFIEFENLHIQNMLANHHLAKSIMDARWYQLQVLTASKAEYAGKKVKLCIANGTSQTCHICGNIQKMMLRDRIFRCHRCGSIEDRDVNSANVVLDRCTAGTAGIEACQSDLTRDIMKQEATLLVGL